MVATYLLIRLLNRNYSSTEEKIELINSTNKFRYMEQS